MENLNLKEKLYKKSNNFQFFKRLCEFLFRSSFLISIIFIFFLSVWLSDIIPLRWKILAFTVSCLSKEILMFIMPVLIFPLIVRSIVLIPSKGIYLIITLFILVFISNLLSILIAYFIGANVIPNISFVEHIKHYKITEVIYPLIKLNLYSISIPIISIVGLVTGIFFTYVPSFTPLNMLEHYYQFSRIVLEKVCAFFLPVYIIGSILKAMHEMNLLSLLPIIGTLVLIIFTIQASYIIILFLMSNGGNILKCKAAIKNMIPAFVVGFSTMSSIITLPTTLKAVEKNTDDCPIAKLWATTTVNYHDIGDCISLPLTALAIVYFVEGYIPNISSYLLFACLAAITQFSAVSIPGGSIIIMLPILTKYIGFTDEMGSLIIAISICLEPLGTAMNVAGNNVLAIIVSKLYSLCLGIEKSELNT